MMTIKDLKEKIKSHKQWLDNDGGVRLDLSSVKLLNADLSNSKLRKAYLSNANIINSKLNKVHIKKIILLKNWHLGIKK